MVKGSNLPAAGQHQLANLVHRPGGAVKSYKTDDGVGWVEGYLVSWGNNTDTDLQGEHFTPRTEFCLDWFNNRPVLYHHGMDGSAGLRKIGTIKNVEVDDLGLWVQAQLDLRDRYAAAVYDMVKAQEFGWSSGSVDHLVKISQKGEILVWPLIEGSITPTPAQPSKTTVRALKSVIDGDPEFGKGLRKFLQAQKELDPTETIVNDVAKALGIRDLDESEVGAVAEVVGDTVRRMVAKAAAKDEETEAALAELEQEMNVEKALLKGSKMASRNRGRSYRSDVLTEDQVAAQMDEIAETMAGEIAAQMEEEIVEKAARSAARRARSLRRARRNITATDDTLAAIDNQPAVTTEMGGLLGQTASGKRYYRRARRGVLPTDEVAAQANALEEEAQMAEEVIDQVATQAYRKGLAHGVRQALRSDVAGVPGALTVEAEAKRFARGRRGVLPEESVMSDDFDADDVPVASYRRARRNALPESEAPVMGDEELVPVASYRRARRGIADPLEEAKSAFARGYRRARRGVLPEESVMTEEEEALLADEEALLSEDELLVGTPKSYRRNARKSADMQDTEYWKRRALKAEMMEAPAQRSSFGRIERVTDEADRPGSYDHAFKSYLYKGLGLMTDSEKYVLTGKGKVDWRDAKGTFKAANFSGKAYSSGSDASAGFAVPPDWVSELNKNIMTQTVMAPECRTRTTTSDRIVQPNLITTDARRAHVAQVRWPGEMPGSSAEHEATQDTYSQVDIPIHVMLVSYSATNSALEDVTFSLENEINEAFSEAVAIAYDDLIWGGNGQGKLEGIVVNQSVIGHRSTSIQTVSGYVPTGSANGIVTADTLKTMLFHLPRGYRPNAKWYMNSDTALEISTLKDGQGNYLIDNRIDALQNSGGMPEKLLGLPIVYNEYADSIASNGYPIVLGDLRRGYVIGKRVDFAIRRFDDSAVADLDQVKFIGRARIGGQVLLPASMKVMKVAAS